MADNGKEFAAAFEHKHYPFYGSQFHPEIGISGVYSSYVKRNFETTQLINAIVIEMVRMTVQFAKPYSTLSGQIKSMIAKNY